MHSPRMRGSDDTFHFLSTYCHVAGPSDILGYLILTRNRTKKNKTHELDVTLLTLQITLSLKRENHL